ncbi:hypothetical protein Tco_0571955, partial [Tanacetum coccineum]
MGCLILIHQSQGSERIDKARQQKENERDRRREICIRESLSLWGDSKVANAPSGILHCFQDYQSHQRPSTA